MEWKRGDSCRLHGRIGIINRIDDDERTDANGRDIRFVWVDVGMGTLELSTVNNLEADDEVESGAD